MDRIRKALERIVNWGYCPTCGCDRANTEDCTWCGFILEARRALRAHEESQESIEVQS